MTGPGRMNTLAIFLVLLTACGSSPPVRYFGLEPADIAYRPDADGSPVVGLGPLAVPEYLDRTQIVTRKRGAEIQVDDFALWAEPMDQAIHTVIATNVDSLLDEVIVIPYPYIKTVQVDYRLTGRVDRFDADESGTVVLDVQWTLADAERKTLVAPRRQRFQSRAEDPLDPDAVARAMNDVLMQLSRDVAERIGGTQIARSRP